MYVACSEHIELAIDEFVEEYECPPDMYMLEEISFTAWSVPKTCDYCQDKPSFLVV